MPSSRTDKVALIAYSAVRGTKQGQLYISVEGWEATGTGILGEPQIQQALRALGLQCSRYAGHSFRTGAATMAAERGITDSTIKVLGRWESEGV